jgi:hypothetical protein
MRIKNLDKNVVERINNILNSGYQVIIGDADGIDSSVQEYLKSKVCDSVVVYCSGEQPRNNLGNWVLERVSTNASPGTRAFFTAKDLKMSEDCDYGLMVWDSKSMGTLKNAIELLKRKKMSLVYVNKVKEFIKVKDVTDFERLISYMSETSFVKADKKLNIRNNIEALKHEQGTLF